VQKQFASRQKIAEQLYVLSTILRHSSGTRLWVATFKNDVNEQLKYQEIKGVDYRSMVVDEISVARNIKLSQLSENIEWVCGADSGDGGKLRINSHGDKRGFLSTNTKASGTSAVDFAKYLAAHGLNSKAMGKPGLTTVNLAKNI
jgi:hypothetical protein